MSLPTSNLLARLAVSGARTPAGTDYAVETDGTVHLEAADAPRLRPDATNGYTIVVALYNAAGSGTIGGTPANREGSWRIDTAAGGFRFIQWYGGGSVVAVNVNGYSPDAGGWVFLAFGADPPNGVIFARANRQIRHTTALPGTVDAGTAALQVGTGATGGSVARFAHLGVWKRALTDAELDTVFNRAAFTSFPGLTGGLADVSEWWDFTETSGNRVGSVGTTALVPSGTVPRATGPATVAPTNTGDPITFWTSEGDARIDLTAIGAARPTYVAAADSISMRAAILFPDDSAVRMVSPGTFGLRAHSVGYVGTSLYRNGIHEHVRIGFSGSGAYAFVGDFGSKVRTEFGGGSLGSSDYAAYERQRYADIRIWTAGASGVTLRINESADLTAAALADADASGFAVGAEGYGAAEAFEEVLLYAEALDATKRNDLHDALRLSYPLPVPSTTLAVVLVTGNSIHYGIGVTAVENDIPSLAMAELGYDYGARWLDFSVPGQSTEQSVADDPARITPYFSPTRLTIELWTEATNDIALYGQNAVQAESHTEAKIASSKSVAASNPFAFVETTMLPRTGSETARAAYNAARRAKYTVPTAFPYVFLPDPSQTQLAGCVLADWAAEPTMGDDGDEANTTYYDAFGIHPTDAGAALLAPISANALRVGIALLSANVPAAMNHYRQMRAA